MKHPLWERLPNELRSRIDELIADDRKLPAIVAIRDTLDQPCPGIYECMDLLAERYAELDQLWFRPSPPLDIDVLARQVAALPHPPDAIEALWDGDSGGWFVCLVAVTLRPKFEYNLALSDTAPTCESSTAKSRRGPKRPKQTPQATPSPTGSVCRSTSQARITPTATGLVGGPERHKGPWDGFAIESEPHSR